MQYIIHCCKLILTQLKILVENSLSFDYFKIMVYIQLSLLLQIDYALKC